MATESPSFPQSTREELLTLPTDKPLLYAIIWHAVTWTTEINSVLPQLLLLSITLKKSMVKGN
jgi:hypothetical protein